VDLPDPLGASPFKVTPGAPASVQTFQRTHGWPITVSPMERWHASFWDEHVSPAVKRMEFERLTGLRECPPRADAYWTTSWSTIRRVHETANRMGASLPTAGAGRETTVTPAHLIAVEALSQAGTPVPIAMMLGVSNFPFPKAVTPGVSGPLVDGRRVRNVFVWLVSVAPPDSLSSWGLPVGLQLGRVALDTAIQISLVSGHFGQVLLHADPRGGDELTRFYAGCMMALVNQTDFPEISLTRRNDGRYFFFDSDRADAFSHRLAPWRRSAIEVVPVYPFAPIRVLP
jgi:hypothetical protein